MIRVIISDENAEHAAGVKAAISAGYGSDISEQIEIISGFYGAYDRAEADGNIEMFVRGCVGVSGYVNTLKTLMPRVLSVWPLGSNTFGLMTNFAATEPPPVVTTGAGDFTNSALDRNNTGYGNGLEFWDHDLTVNDDSEQSSFSNGIIAGKLLKIKDALSCSWWEARYRARATATRTEPNRLTTPWDLCNGYGKIDTAAAIAYSGVISSNPYTESTPETSSDYSFTVDRLYIRPAL